MTGQDWVIIGAAWVALALPLGGVMWDQVKATERLRRAERVIAGLHRRLMHHELAGPDQPTSAGGAMPPVTGEHRAIGGMVQGPTWDREDGPEVFVPRPAPANVWAEVLAKAEATVQLHHRRPPDPPRSTRPPALTIESVLARSGRPLSRSEIAAQLGRPAEDITGELRNLIVDHVATFALDTLGRTVYGLTEVTR